METIEELHDKILTLEARLEKLEELEKINREFVDYLADVIKGQLSIFEEINELTQGYIEDRNQLEK